MTRSAACPGRSWRLLAAAALAGAAALAPASYAASDDCGPTLEPSQAETLRVRLTVPAEGLRLGGVSAVDVHVSRDGAGPAALTGMDGAHVSLRVRTGRVTSFVDGTADASGRAPMSVTLDSRALTGPAEVVAEVWADTAPHHGCQYVVREHGATTASTRVSR